MSRRYRKSNAEALLEIIAWCFSGPSYRSCISGIVWALALCVVVPSVLGSHSSGPLAISNVFNPIADGSFYAGLFFCITLNIVGIYKLLFHEVETV